MTVREAHAADGDVVAALWRDLDALHARVAPGYFAAAGSDDSARRSDDRYAAILVAELDGAVHGAVQLQIYDTPRDAGMVARRRLYVERIAIARDRRRRGLGRALMDAALDWARARGATQVALSVWAGNDGAEAFYRALGFASVTLVLGREI